MKLCGLHFNGDLLFGPDLEAIFDRTTDKIKAFPVKKQKVPLVKNNFRPPQQTQGSKEAGHKKPWNAQSKQGRAGVLFRPPEQPT